VLISKIAVYVSTDINTGLFFQELMIVERDIMEEINKMEKAEVQAENKWMDYWRNSVDNIKQLYAM
jgi:hypothetical protein